MKKNKKNEFTTHLNKTSPLVHKESKFDVIDVSKKLMKYIVHLFKRKIEKKMFLFPQGVQIANN
jgi:hypothetical protein